jgi:hypothetical protein
VKRGLQQRKTESEAQPDISQRHDRAAALRTNPDAPENWSLQRLPGPLEKGRRGRSSSYNKAGNPGFTIQSPDKAEAGRAKPFPVVKKSKRLPVLAEALKQTEAQRNGPAAAKDLAGGKRRAQRARTSCSARVARDCGAGSAQGHSSARYINCQSRSHAQGSAPSSLVTGTSIAVCWPCLPPPRKDCPNTQAEADESQILRWERRRGWCNLLRRETRKGQLIATPFVRNKCCNFRFIVEAHSIKDGALCNWACLLKRLGIFSF